MGPRTALAIATALAAACGGCVSASNGGAAVSAARGADASPPTRYAPNIELPEGTGKALVERACTQCHDLAGLAAYKGYWGRDRWDAMVATMIEHGAALDQAQKDVVVAYLTEFFGPAERD